MNSLFPTMFDASAPAMFPINIPTSAEAPTAAARLAKAKKASPAPIVSLTFNVNAGHDINFPSSTAIAPFAPLVSHPPFPKCFSSFLL